MKYIKTFESLEKLIIKPVDIVIRYNHDRSDELYIIVNQEEIRKDQIWIRSFQIGNIGNDAYGKRHASLIFNRKSGIVGIRDGTFHKLGKSDIDLFYTEVKRYNDDTYYVKTYLDIIKEKTGFDLYDSDKFRDWLISNDADKYNL